MNDLVPDVEAGEAISHAAMSPYKARHKTPRGNPRPIVLGQCNASHTVEYVYASLLRDLGRAVPGREAAHVYRWDVTYGHGFPPVDDRSSVNLLLANEPPAHLPFREVPESAGYSGLVGFRRAAAVWKPLSMPAHVWEGVRKMADEAAEGSRRRRSVGIYVSNCDRGTEPWAWRWSAIEALTLSKLPVVSYGRCAHTPNTSSSIRKYSVGSNHELICRQHRLMLAIENFPCDDWISPHVADAIALCGAIPIVRTAALPPATDGEHDAGAGWSREWSRRGRRREVRVPDYRGYFRGRLPMIDVSDPDWLGQVEQVVNNDTYYAEMLAAAGRAAARALNRPRPGAVLSHQDYHCSWFELMQGGGPRPQVQRVSWERCLPVIT